MKDLIKKILKEETEPVLRIPSARYFGGIEGLKTYIETNNITRWSLGDKLILQEYEGDLTWLEGLVSISGSLDLLGTQIKSLGNLKSVGGSLYLSGTKIKSLPNLQSVGRNLWLRGTQIESLGNLQSVGGSLFLSGTKIKSLGNLQSVGGYLYLNEYLSEKYTDEEIRSMINIGGDIERG
jgi:hypothetical protein